MDFVVKNRTFSTPPFFAASLNSETSTQLEEGTSSVERSIDASPLMISSTTSEQWHSKQSQSEELISPFSLKKEPQKSRIKTIGKNLTQFKKNFISLNQLKPRSQDHIIEDPMNATNKMEIPEKYEFLEVLGKGAQGIVYKVQDKETREIFAAKKIIISDSETYQNIQTEIKILQELNHENIIQVHEIINDDSNNSIYCVLEYFPCKTLQELLKSKHVFTPDQLKHIITKILLALQYLHEQNICHRDLSLNNVLICTEFKKVKLIDFGVAKKILHSSKMMLSPVGKSTNFPPEFECDGFYSTKYDIWLMGLLLLQIICKTHISSKTALQIVKGLKEKNPKYTGSIVLSEECENLMGQFLEPNPDNRINATEALRHKWLLN